MKVSILIPVYNSALHLDQALQSALDQTWPEKEIVVVDDGSTDNSVTIAKSYSKKGLIKFFQQDNGGACKARNRAFAESTGEYIQYLDADDLLAPNKIENQLARIQPSDNNFIMSSSVVRFTEAKELADLIVTPKFLDRDWDNPLDWLYYSWTGRGVGQTSIWLTPRHLIERAGPWNETLSINQDGEFFCRVLLACKGIRYCAESEVYYRSGNNDSVSQQKNRRKAEDLLITYRLYHDHILKVDTSARIKWALACNYQSFLYVHNREYPDLVIKAQSYLKELSLSKYPLVGSKKFKCLAALIGFTPALKLRDLIRSIIDPGH